MAKRIGTSLPILPKANFMLRLDTEDVYGEHPIYIYYIVNEKTAKVPAGIYVSESYWDSRHMRVRNTHPRCSQLNSYLQLKRHEFDANIMDFVMKGGELSIYSLRAILKGESPDEKIHLKLNFIEFANEVIEKEYKLQKIGISVLNNAKCSLNIFQRYLRIKLKKDSITIKAINKRIIEDYIIWRKEERENTNETINKSLTPIFKTIRKTVSLGIFEPKQADEIFNLYLPPTRLSLNDDGKNEEIRYLSYAQLQQFIDLYNIVKYDRTRDYMDLFLFSFHTCGMRFVDLLTL